jgi:hypothetical protein
MVDLDIGEAPEVRQKALLFVIDVKSWNIVYKTGPVLGKKGHITPPLPFFRPPGAGTIYVDTVRGKEVSKKVVYRAIRRIPWIK